MEGRRVLQCHSCGCPLAAVAAVTSRARCCCPGSDVGLAHPGAPGPRPRRVQQRSLGAWSRQWSVCALLSEVVRLVELQPLASANKALMETDTSYRLSRAQDARSCRRAHPGPATSVLVERGRGLRQAPLPRLHRCGTECSPEKGI